MPSPASGRYARPRGTGRTEAEWHEIGRTAIVALLEFEHAVTIAEMEARLSDRVWDLSICPDPIDPHILTTARAQLVEEGTIVATIAPTKGTGGDVKTWSLPPQRPLLRKIEDAAQRKRLLTARHNGWSRRGGSGLGLIGRAGEDALADALGSARSLLTRVTGSTKQVLGVDVSRMGEIDNSAIYIDDADLSDPTVISVIFEVKNTRSWYYSDDAEVRWFLAKVARIQAARAERLMLPVFLCRRRQFTLWDQGESDGFLPAQVGHQLVLPDSELTQERFEEVRVELGYEDMILGNSATNQHLGIVSNSMRNYARERAELWAQNHTKYLLPQI